MKKIISILLCLATLFTLSACAGGGKANGTTLMIYMVGSDLEAKGGSGTNDMKEMLESQVDLSKNNVVIYAGGSKKWHNESLSAESGHTILRLTAEGFETLETRDEVSMGDAEPLTYFLNYAYDNFKADDFALILWDHGNGPLIGYGKDMLHEDDSLTLLEMQTALKDSPFSGENKLSWVGFDACLMSSVELACIWQDHAEYLIASQEIEPSFGWNYSFLSQLGQKNAKDLAGDITSQYMESCLAYYEKRNFDQRDTTLACLELSAFAPLKTALESLFVKAGNDVDADYSELVTTRVNTRALGRATTGSEYDLIDLVDLAEKMKARYPAEAESVINTAKDLVVHNVTNAEGCSGLSIYYPFYNKSYYQKTWGDMYSKLGLLPSYVKYLESYAKKWLKNDLLETVASSVTPTVLSKNEFELSLTEEQSKNFADATYYVLQREGDQIYTRIYTSSNVVKKDNKLVANFDGNVLYAKNKFDSYWIPAVDEHDTVGDYTRCSTYVNLTNSLPIMGDDPEGHKNKVEGHRFHISINNKTKQIKTSALVPYDTEVETENLSGGKLEDADLSKWSQYYFLQERHLYLKRDKNGTILPLSKWEKSSYFSANVSRVDDGVEFVLAPIPKGEYYLIFETEDVQGNRYCSELLPIKSEGAELPGDFEEKAAEVSWDSGEKVELFSQEGVTAYLTTVKKYDDSVRFSLQVENKNNFDVSILADNLAYNNSVSCPDGTNGYFNVPAGATVTDDSGIDFGNVEEMGVFANLQSVQFTVSVVTRTGDRTLIYNKPVRVNLSKETANLRKDPPADAFLSSVNQYVVNSAFCNLNAKNQVLFEREGLRATLLGLGGNNSGNYLIFNFCFENTTAQEKNLAIKGIGFDNVFVTKGSGPITVASKSKVYQNVVIFEDDLKKYQITSATSVSIWVSHMQFATLNGGGGFAQTEKYPVQLTQSGAAVNFQQGKTLLYKNSEVQLFLQKAEKREYGGYLWTCTMVNNGKRDFMLGAKDVTFNGKKVATDSLGASVLTPYDDICPAGMSTTFEVTYTGDKSNNLKVTFVPQFYDIAGERLLLEGTKIELND